MTNPNVDRAVMELEAAGGEIAAAEAGVTRAGLALSASLHDASLVGRETAERFVSALRPVLIGAGVLAGVVLAARLLRSRGGARERRPTAGAAERSLLIELARSTAIALATIAARRLAARWLGAGSRAT